MGGSEATTTDSESCGLLRSFLQTEPWQRWNFPEASWLGARHSTDKIPVEEFPCCPMDAGVSVACWLALFDAGDHFLTSPVVLLTEASVLQRLQRLLTLLGDLRSFERCWETALTEIRSVWVRRLVEHYLRSTTSGSSKETGSKVLVNTCENKENIESCFANNYNNSCLYIECTVKDVSESVESGSQTCSSGESTASHTLGGIPSFGDTASSQLDQRTLSDDENFRSSFHSTCDNSGAGGLPLLVLCRCLTLFERNALCPLLPNCLWKNVKIHVRSTLGHDECFTAIAMETVRNASPIMAEEAAKIAGFMLNMRQKRSRQLPCWVHDQSKVPLAIPPLQGYHELDVNTADPAAVIENDLFSGRCIVRVRGICDRVDAAYFDKKKRRCQVVLQGRLKTKLAASKLFTGIIFAQRLKSLPSNLILKGVSTCVNAAFGSVTLLLAREEKPLVQLPFLGAVQTLVATPPGQRAPSIGSDEFEEDSTALGIHGLTEKGRAGRAKRRKLLIREENLRLLELDTENELTMEMYEHIWAPHNNELCMPMFHRPLHNFFGAQPACIGAWTIGENDHDERWLFNLQFFSSNQVVDLLEERI